MNRKDFLSTGALLGAFTLAPGSTKVPEENAITSEDDLFLDIPVYCSHEHWGSINSIGQFPGGFNADLRPGARPLRKTTLLDLLADPYMSGSLIGYGFNPYSKEFGALNQNLPELALKDPVQAWEILSEPLKNFHLKGTYQSLRLGVKLAYGYDIHSFDRDLFLQANAQVAENYNEMYDWYKKLMIKASLANLIRPVHPEFYMGDHKFSSAIEESDFTSTVLRIDSFMDFWQPEQLRRNQLVQETGIDPVNAGSWRSFLEKIFTKAKDNGCVGIKQLQAYMRSLNFDKPADESIEFRGKLSKEETSRFQNWVIHECCRLANDLEWPHQVHVGTHNHPHSNPLPLETIARLYPAQKIVMLHCWPYIEEAGYLAQAYPNVYMDTCWQIILNPAFLKRSLETWLAYIPLNKITMSNDSTSVEMAAGASMISRKILAEVLSDQKLSAGITNTEIWEIAASLLHNNALDIYGTGSKYLI